MTERTTDSPIQQAIHDLAIDVPIYKIVADDDTLTIHCYGGKVKTWKKPNLPHVIPVDATARETQDVDGIGATTAASLARHGITTIADLVDAFYRGTLQTYLPRPTMAKAEAWLAEHGYIPHH